MPVPTARRAWLGPLVALGVLALYLALPGGAARDVVYAGVGIWCVVAIELGVRRHRPDHRAPWHLMALGQACSVAGDCLYSWYNDALHVDPFPSLADAFYLAAYPLIGVGLALLLRGRSRDRDLPGWLDSAVVSMGLGLLIWVLVAGPALHATGEPLLGRTVGVAYPVADILLLAMVVRLVFGPGARTLGFRLLVAATTALLLADTVFAAISARTEYEGGVLDLAWLGSYLLWGAAALHPSMRTLSAPGRRRVVLSTRRLVAMSAAVLVAPSILLVELVAGIRLDAWAVTVASALLFLLVVLRMRLAADEIQAAARQRDRLEDDLAHRSTHDALTGVANRDHTVRMIDAALEDGRGSAALVGLLFVHLADFWAVNQAHGHAVGDDVLREVARRLGADGGAGQSVGRLSGDEFVVLLVGLASDHEVVVAAQRLLEGACAPMTVQGADVVVTAGGGVATARGGGARAEDVIGEAEVAARRAKASGTGLVEVFDDLLRLELDERTRVEQAIRDGLAGGEFVLHYQPIVHALSGDIKGYEALVRWQRPGGGGLVPPDEFIPAAERSELICDLGRWVLREATGQLARWAVGGRCGADWTVAVNISGRHLVSPEMVPDVVAALAAAALPPERLVIEITETVFVEHPTAAAQTAALRALGVAVSIDDFGTGYTSIGQMRHLDADILKIDKSLVNAAGPGADELVRLCVHAAHAFGLHVVAEGVETADQLHALQAIGCDLVQGYLIARPAPAETITRDLPAGPTVAATAR